MFKHASQVVIIKPRPAHVAIVEAETEWMHEVQIRPGVGAEANDVARIRGNARLVENDGWQGHRSLIVTGYDSVSRTYDAGGGNAAGPDATNGNRENTHP